MLTNAVRAYNKPCSIFSWQAMQCFAHGTASSRFCCKLFLAVRAHAVFVRLDALPSRVDPVQDRAGRMGDAMEARLRVGVCRLVREVHRGSTS